MKSSHLCHIRIFQYSFGENANVSPNFNLVHKNPSPILILQKWILHYIENSSHVKNVLYYFKIHRNMYKVTERAQTVSFYILVICVYIIFVLPILELETLNTVFAMVGKFGSAMAYPIVYVFSAELFPTVVRNAGMGASSCASRIGGMIAPYIADLVCYIFQRTK